MSNEAIYSAMVAKLKGSGLGLDIAYADTKFAPPAGAKEWLELVFIPNEVQNPYLAHDSAERFTGLFNINYAQRPNRGLPKGSTRAEQVKDLFKRGDCLAFANINRSPSVLPKITESDRTKYPVRVFYIGET